MGRYQYRYRKYRHIGTFFGIGSIGIGKQKKCADTADTVVSAISLVSAIFTNDRTCWKAEKLLYPLVSVSAVSAKASIGISAYRQKCGIGPSLLKFNIRDSWNG